MKLSREEVAAKQLESAIWMYAFDFDETAVHTIAGAAFELYTLRLGLGVFKEQATKHIIPGKEKEFWKIVNKPYNFFKHGGRKDEYLEYNPDSVDFILWSACEANLVGDKKYRLEAAHRYQFFFMIKYPDTILLPHFKQELEKRIKSSRKTGVDLQSRETLKIWLRQIRTPTISA